MNPGLQVVGWGHDCGLGDFRREVVTTTTEEVLRRLALQDESVLPTLLAMRMESNEVWLQQKTQAIARVSALIALDASTVSYQAAVIDALACGVTTDEVVGTLIAVAPIVGLARVTSATPAIALAMGYDLDKAFEQFDATANGTGQ